MELTNMALDFETRLTKLKPILPLYLKIIGSTLAILGFIGFAIWRNPLSAWSFTIGIILAVVGFNWKGLFG